MNDSNRTPGDPRGAGPNPDPRPDPARDRHEQLVALALGQLADDDARSLRASLEQDDAAAREYTEISAHFALHDQVEQLTPPPALWNRIRDEIDRSAPRSFFERIWMPAAAAALVAFAFLVPESAGSPSMTALHGTVAAAKGDGYVANGLARIALADAGLPGRVTVTVDGDTRFALPETRRLALRAGRVFLDISPELSGGDAKTAFRVEAGPLRVVTTGTAYVVERDGESIAVTVVRGSVRCEWPDGARDVRAGEVFSWPARTCERTRVADATAWFRTPVLHARVVDARSLAVTVRNETPDPIRLAAPTGGEPLFWGSYADRQVPLGPERDPILHGPVELWPGQEKIFTVRLPHPLPAGEALFVTYPARGLRVRAGVPAAEPTERNR